MAELVCPGQRLGDTEEFDAGQGTYEYHGRIHASICGRVTKQKLADGGGQKKQRIEVISDKHGSVVPEIGSICTARVLKVNPRLANLSILCVGDRVAREAFDASIRAQDVRATQIDSVQMYECFRPGDIVRAEVISLGDARSYFLSTAGQPSLGVIHAKSLAGVEMQPISATEMLCPTTHTIEHRKVAKVS